MEMNITKFYATCYKIYRSHISFGDIESINTESSNRTSDPDDYSENIYLLSNLKRKEWPIGTTRIGQCWLTINGTLCVLLAYTRWSVTALILCLLRSLSKVLNSHDPEYFLMWRKYKGCHLHI